MGLEIGTASQHPKIFAAHGLFRPLLGAIDVYNRLDAATVQQLDEITEPSAG